MIRCKSGEIEWLEFEILQSFPEVVHGVFLRHGGVSSAPFDSLNFSTSRGDHLLLVKENRKRAFDILGLKNVASVRAMHEDRILVVQDENFPLCDGLITGKKNMGLLVTHADCQSAIFFDPKKKIIANIHCGWRGNVLNIYSKTIQFLKNQFHCMAKDLIVCISPSLGPEKSEFIHYKKELPKTFFSFQIREYFFDFWKISKMQLEAEGILKHNIEIAKLCTFSCENDFFSHRRNKKTGRNATIVALKKTDSV